MQCYDQVSRKLVSTARGRLYLLWGQLWGALQFWRLHIRINVKHSESTLVRELPGEALLLQPRGLLDRCRLILPRPRGRASSAVGILFRRLGRALQDDILC